MKPKVYIPLVILVVLFAALAFIPRRSAEEQGTTPPPAPTANIPGDLTLGVGETGTAGTLSIAFNSLVQDSRCPIDVQCIQAGAVNTNVTFTNGSETKTFNMPSDEVPQRFAGYSISITNVEPGRKSGQEVAAGAYRVTFHIERIPTAVAGGRCGGNMTNAPVCGTGYHCAPEPGSHLPFGDVGGICVPDAL